MENISAVLAELKKIKDKSNKTIAELAGIGTFLHNFFVHAYSFLLDESELRLLVDDVFDTYSRFKEEINAFISGRNSKEN
jgi:uncharacterized protein YutE (UPF0331/DUF86 family)